MECSVEMESVVCFSVQNAGGGKSIDCSSRFFFSAVYTTPNRLQIHLLFLLSNIFFFPRHPIKLICAD